MLFPRLASTLLLHPLKAGGGVSKALLHYKPNSPRWTSKGFKEVDFLLRTRLDINDKRRKD